MTRRFDYVECLIESNNVVIMSIDDHHSSLLVHKQRMKGRNDEVRPQESLILEERY